MKCLPLASLAAVAALLLPMAAQAQDKAAAPTEEQIAKGKADVPALLQAAGARCAVTDAADRGSGDASGKKTEIYEAACSDGPGLLILNTQGAPKPLVYPCLAVADQKTRCVLAANADQKAGLSALAAAAGRPCQTTNVRYMGTSTASGETFYELACQGGGGFRLGMSGATAKPDITDCLALVGTGQQCTFTTKAQALAGLTPLIKASGRTCQVSDARFIGASDANHASYYEVACGPSGGFVIATDDAGKFQRSLDCSQAGGLGGGCTLTKVDPTQERAHYTQLAASVGYQCQVNRDRLLGTDSDGRSAVEIACANRPDGAIALFPTTPTGKTEVYDCVRAGMLGQTCQLTQPTALYGQYSSALAAKGRSTCKVSNARYVGALGSGGYVVETACSDGKPGWVIYFARGATPVVSQLLTCQQSTNDGRPCQLPGNKG